MLFLFPLSVSSESLALCSPESESDFVGWGKRFAMVSFLFTGIALFVVFVFVFSSFSGVAGGIAVTVRGGESKVTFMAG